MNKQWKRGIRSCRAELLHESGLVHIVKYRDCQASYRARVPAVFYAYYRKTVNSPFGWYVDPSTPFYTSLADAKNAGERYIDERMAVTA